MGIFSLSRREIFFLRAFSLVNVQMSVRLFAAVSLRFSFATLRKILRFTKLLGSDVVALACERSCRAAGGHALASGGERGYALQGGFPLPSLVGLRPLTADLVLRGNSEMSITQ